VRRSAQPFLKHSKREFGFEGNKFLFDLALLRELSFPKKILTFVIHFIILHK